MSAAPKPPAIDHLVIAALTLDGGVADLERRLGVRLSPGGEHALFGTHNRLLSLGPLYLEIIAVNPAAPEPTRPRWFGLDEARQAGTKLIHWVARTPTAPLPVQGERLSLTRGRYAWTLSVPADGSLPLGGVLPSLIEWQTDAPAAALPDAGLRLRSLELFTPQPDELRAALIQLHLLKLVTVQSAPGISLRAVLDTPGGEVTLD